MIELSGDIYSWVEGHVVAIRVKSGNAKFERFVEEQHGTCRGTNYCGEYDTYLFDYDRYGDGAFLDYQDMVCDAARDAFGLEDEE